MTEMMSARSRPAPTPLEQRIRRRLEARGELGLTEALLGLKGVVFGNRYRLISLYAVGGEGAVFLTKDVTDPSVPLLVAKLALLPVHKPFELNANDIRKRRYLLRVEAQYLGRNRSPFMPLAHGTFEFRNPLLDAERGDAFAELEPVLVMEKLPGRDLDLWLARTHRSEVPQAIMRRTLDRVAVVLLQALVDLYDRGLFYADLRPGNLRMLRRPERRVRLLDAGSLVDVQDISGRFPHVPAYLAPETYHAALTGQAILPSTKLQAIMAGRTLFEVATGRVPLPGQQVNLDLLKDSNVSTPVADVIDGLCRGDFPDVRMALRYLVRRARRRVEGGNDPRNSGDDASSSGSHAAPASATSSTSGRTSRPVSAAPEKPVRDTQGASESSAAPERSFFGRLLDKLLRR